MANGTVGVASVVLKLKDSQKFKQGLQSCKTMFASVGNAIKTIAKSIVVAIGAATAGLVGFAKKAIDAAAEWENVQMSFESMLGKKGAKDYTQWMKGFALSTSFEQKDLVDGSKMLMSYGFNAEQAKYAMQQLGKAVDATGDPSLLERYSRALGRMQALGKVNAETMNMLQEAGVSGWAIIAEKSGKSIAEIQDMSKKGILDSATAIPMLLEGIAEKYSNATTKMSDTTNGKISTMQDTWHQLLVDFGTILLPFVNKAVDWITSALEIINDYINENKDKISGFIQGLVGKGLEIANKVVGVVLIIIENFKKGSEILRVIQNTFVVIHNIVIGVAQGIGNIVQGLIMIGTGLKEALSGEWSGQGGFERKKRWFEENAEMFKSINEQMNGKYLSFAKPFSELEDQINSNGIIQKATDFMNKLNEKVAQKTREREAQMANASNSLKNPGFGTPKTDTDAILEAYKEMYKKLEEMAKNYRDKLAKWGVSSWATQIFGGVGETMNQVYNATVQKPEEQQIDLLQQIAINTGGIPEQNKFMTMQAIPLEGYNAY